MTLVKRKKTNETNSYCTIIGHSTTIVFKVTRYIYILPFFFLLFNEVSCKIKQENLSKKGSIEICVIKIQRKEKVIELLSATCYCHYMHIYDDCVCMGHSRPKNTSRHRKMYYNVILHKKTTTTRHIGQEERKGTERGKKLHNSIRQKNTSYAGNRMLVF